MNMMNAQTLEQAKSLSLDAMMQLAMDIFDTPRPAPPAWMVAPSFRGAEPVVVREEQTRFRAGAVVQDLAPYRSIREVPRAA